MDMVGKEKVTWMKLTTKPLDNEKNYSKVKKAFCSLPQIQDQLYDEKSKETVTIKVVCCSPEKVADKLCKKGGGAILKIEYGIDNPLAPKHKEEEKPKEAPAASSYQGPPMYNGSYDGYTQPYWYPQRTIHDSYGGGDSSCTIM